MKKRFLLASFLSFFLTAFTAHAQINYDAAYSPFKINLNLNLSISKIEDIDAATGVTAGGKGIYFINPNIGFHTGLSYSQVNGEANNVDFKSTFLDIPFGMSFRYNLFPDGTVESIIHFGLYYGLPLGKGKAGVDDDVDLKGVVGLNVEYGTLFMVNEGLSMGFNIFVKNAFGDIVKDAKDTSYYSWGLGLLMQFM